MSRALLLFAVLGSAATPAIADPIATAEYYPLLTGSSWDYELRDGQSTLSGTVSAVGLTLFAGEATQQLDAVAPEGTTSSYLTSDVRGVLLHGEAGPDPDVGVITLAYDPPVVLVPGEVEGDDLDNSSGTVVISAPGFPSLIATYGYSWQISAIGRITSPAGTYCDAVTVAASLTLSVPGESPLVLTSSTTLVRGLGEVHDIGEIDGQLMESTLLGSTLPVPPPDLDCDGVPDALDNCEHWPNDTQADIDANAIGDACECGDQTGDGRVDISDILAINAVIFKLQPASPLCDTNDDALCNVGDILGANGKIFGQPTHCARFPGP